MSRMSAIQNTVGRPPKRWPCLCSAMSWCSCAGAADVIRIQVCYKRTFGHLLHVDGVLQLDQMIHIVRHVQYGRDWPGEFDGHGDESRRLQLLRRVEAR